MKKSNKSPADRATINRINARLSTGPRTDKGKASSRLNALRHTLSSQTVVSSNNNLVAYTKFQNRFFDDLQPKGIIESSSSRPWPTAPGVSTALAFTKRT